MYLRSLTYNNDCLEDLPLLPNKFAYLAYCDTPYGLKEDGRKSASRSHKVLQKNGTSIRVNSSHKPENWDTSTMSPYYWNLVKQKSIHQVIFGVNYLHKNISYIDYNWANAAPKRTDFSYFIEANPYHFILWDKCNGSNDFRDCEVIWTSLPIVSTVKQFMWNGMMQAKNFEEGHIQQGNKKLNQKRIHPTEKPILFNEWLFLTLCCFENCTIIDTHSGSQSARIAAQKLNYNYYGWETVTSYFLNGNSRFDNLFHV